MRIGSAFVVGPFVRARCALAHFTTAVPWPVERETFSFDNYELFIIDTFFNWSKMIRLSMEPFFDEMQRALTM